MILEELIKKGLNKWEDLFNSAWNISFYDDINTNRKYWNKIALYQTWVYIKESEAKELWLIKLYNNKTSFEINNPEEWYRLSNDMINKILNWKF